MIVTVTYLFLLSRELVSKKSVEKFGIYKNNFYFCGRILT